MTVGKEAKTLVICFVTYVLDAKLFRTLSGDEDFSIYFSLLKGYPCFVYGDNRMKGNWNVLLFVIELCGGEGTYRQQQ